MNTEVIHRGGAEDAEEMQRKLTEKIISAALEVHTLLGPGLLESVYQAARLHELDLRGLPCSSQAPVPVRYKNVQLQSSLRMDLLVAESVVVEIKAVDALAPIHSARLLTYLRLTGPSVGLLLNFNTVHLRQDIKRVVNTVQPLRTSAPSVPLR